jgi:DNA-binding LytR/AlgR family response regulator
MNVLIVENEKPAAEGLCRLLKKIDNTIKILATTESVETTINWLQNNTAPELIFMDIQLDDGLCFELFEAVKLAVPVIFTTAFDQYMLSAFKVNSVDYLLKPVEEMQLRAALDKFKSIYVEKPDRNDLLNNFLKTLNTGYKNRFLIKVGTNYKSIPVSEISCFYILERSVFIRLFSGKDYAIDYSLEYLQKVIDPDQFFRINRNCILNISAVSDILCYSSSRLEIKLGNNKPIDNLIVSRDKVGEFKKWIDK